MNSQTYSDLYRNWRSQVESPCAEALNSLRGGALNALDSFGLPHKGCEEYRHTDISSWFEPDWGLNLMRKEVTLNTAMALRYRLQGIDAAASFLANDTFIKGHDMPQDITVDSLDSYLRHNTGSADCYGGLADVNSIGIAAVNTLFCQDGVAIIVPDGITVERPIQLITLLGGDMEMMVNRRILLVLGHDSHLKLIITDHSLSPHSMLTTQVIEAYVRTGASLQFYDIEETGSLNMRVSETYVYCEADSNVMMHNLTLRNGRTRNSLFVSLAGRGASLRAYGAVIAAGRQHVDNYTSVDHQVSGCTSNELFKYCLDGHAVGNFYGKVLVRKDSQNTVSEQINRNICLNSTARMYTQPQLEIYADDVKCSHGATVGQLDQNALFYMRQRGIPEPEARLQLLSAFYDDVFADIDLPPLRERLKHVAEKRLRGEQGVCKGCSACKP